MPSVLITGAARGLGFEFVRQYAADGWRVLAVARDPAGAGELRELATASGGRITVHGADVADPASVASLAKALEGIPIDVLINNAGTMGAHTFATMGRDAQSFGKSDYDDWVQMFRINTQGPMLMAEVLLPNVVASEQKKIVTLTSIVGSIGANTSGSLYAYRSTKAGANAVMRSMALDLANRGVICASLHPGWVKTDLGGPKAPVETADSVRGMRQVIAALNRESSGRFLQFDGKELPW